jgi:hypothetical protein
MKKIELEQEVIQFLDKTLKNGMKISILGSDMPGYPLKNHHVDIRKENNTYLVGIEDFLLCDNYDAYLIPSFSIGVLNDETRLKYKITCALFEEQLKWLLEQLVNYKFELV